MLGDQYFFNHVLVIKIQAIKDIKCFGLRTSFDLNLKSTN